MELAGDQSSYRTKLRQSIIETERLLIEEDPTGHLADDMQLEYYVDGYPKLPACLHRRQVLDFAQAA